MGASRLTFALIVRGVVRVYHIRIAGVGKADKCVRLQEITVVASPRAGVRFGRTLWGDLQNIAKIDRAISAHMSDFNRSADKRRHSRPLLLFPLL